MKKQNYLVLLTLLFTFSFTACKKELKTISETDTSDSKIETGRTQSVITRQFGVNYNTQLSPTDLNGFVEVDRTHANWVRGNLKFFDLYQKYVGGQNWAADSNIIGYKSIKGHGLRAAANIKFDFSGYGLRIPARGSATADTYLDFLTLLLQEIMPYTDLIVSGNEPFISSLEVDKTSQNLVDFYMLSAHRIRTWENNNARTDIPIFLGSFDDADRPERQTNPAYLSLLDSVKQRAWITGADLHLHNRGGADITDALNFVLSKIGTTKKFMSSEFSLMNLWKDHTGDELTLSFRSFYPQPARVDSDGDGKKEVWEYMNDALKYPRTLAEWNKWNDQTPFLYDNRNYICSTYKTFTNSKYNPQFQIAFYGIGIESTRLLTFGPNDAPWSLNALFVHNFVVPDANGLAQKRYFFCSDFIALRDGTLTSCGF